MHDMRMKRVVLQNISAGVSWYLMAAYAYYELDDPILTDDAFDWLGKTLLKRWPEVSHRHSHMISEDDLRAGSLLRRDFPEIVKDATRTLPPV